MILRDEILATENEGFTELHRVLHTIPEDRWTAPVTGEWTVKDIIAHVACWLSEAAVQLENIRAGHPVDWPDVEKFNQLAYEECKDLTVHEVKAMLSASRHRLREELAMAAPVALNSRLVTGIHESTDLHYKEHMVDLRKAAAVTS